MGRTILPDKKKRISLLDVSTLVQNEFEGLTVNSGFVSSPQEYDSALNYAGEPWKFDAYHQTNTVSCTTLIFRATATALTWKGLAVRSGKLVEKSGNGPAEALDNNGWTDVSVFGQPIYVKTTEPFWQVVNRTGAKFTPEYLMLGGVASDSIAFPSLLVRSRIE